MRLTSSAIKDGGIIPSRYTCEGANKSPPLAWADAPSATASFVLIMEDPDVPKNLRPDGMWDHWVLFNIPASVHSLTEGAMPPGISGKTTFGHTRYGGPCPPDREHRYFFKLYALDTLLDLPQGADKKTVQHALQKHVLAQAELMGRYEKGKGY